MTDGAPRRVVFVLSALAVGGAERTVLTLLRHLSRERFHLHLVALQGGPLREDLPNDVEVHLLNAARVRYAVPGLVTLLRRLAPDVVVSTQWYLNAQLLLLRRWVPGSVVIREINGEYYLKDSILRKPFYRLYLRWCRAADRIVFQTNAALRDAVGRAPALRARAIRIYNPVDFARIAEQTHASASPYPAGRRHIVTAGRLIHTKGFDLVLRAFAELRARVEADLTILGDGPLRLPLEELSRQLGVSDRVHWAGTQRNPFPYFRHADVLVLASRHEGSPNVLLEALAVGCPVVATDCRYGPAEIVQQDVNGILVPRDDPQALAAALRAVLSDDGTRSRLAGGAQGSIQSFTVGDVVGQWTAVLSGVP